MTVIIQSDMIIMISNLVASVLRDLAVKRLTAQWIEAKENMGNSDYYHTNHNKTRQSPKSVHISLDVLYIEILLPNFLNLLFYLWWNVDII